MLYFVSHLRCESFEPFLFVNTTRISAVHLIFCFIILHIPALNYHTATRGIKGLELFNDKMNSSKHDTHCLVIYMSTDNVLYARNQDTLS